jgi:hypothetical protein
VQSMEGGKEEVSMLKKEKSKKVPVKVPVTHV